MEEISKADLLLHPIRIRILMALAGTRKTAQQLAADLPDVPQATLYRHINRLAHAGILKVVEGRPTRSTIEKVYALDWRTSNLSQEEMGDLNKDDQMRYFITFLASLMDDFSRYLHGNDSFDMAADYVGYHKFPVELNDEEFLSLTQKMNAAFKPYIDNQPASDRQRYIFAFINMPDVKKSGQ